MTTTITNVALLGDVTAQLTEAEGLLLMAPDRMLEGKVNGQMLVLPAKSFRLPPDRLDDLAELLTKGGHIAGVILSLYDVADAVVAQPSPEGIAALAAAVVRCDEFADFRGAVERVKAAQRKTKAEEAGQLDLFEGVPS